MRVWRTADTDISTNFTPNYLSLIKRQQVISRQDSGLRADNVTILTFKLPTYLQTSSWPHQALPGGRGAPGFSEVRRTLILFIWTAN